MVEFYDGFAADYHLVYGDRWDEAVKRQGAALDELIRKMRPNARDVLDCSCGIGTQAIGLARRGYAVTGTDVSQHALERARVEAARLGATVSFAIADFRDLHPVAGNFDVVLSCDNAIPHLLDDGDIRQALLAMRLKLRRGGLLLLSTRDYDRALRERPALGPPIMVAGPPRRIVIRLHDWDAAPSPFYTVRFLILTETAAGWTLVEHSTRYRAITSAALARVATNAGFVDVRWLMSDETGFHQPLMIATVQRPAK